MRLLLPQLDSERPTYGLRESSLADAYIQALGLSKALEHAIRLKNYKTPYRGGKDPSAAAGVSGDFALVLADVLKRYDDVPEGRSTITVREVNDMLDQLSQDKEKGSEVRVRVFRKCVLEMSPNENLWFTRIITKDLKMGMKHESMLKMFHPDAQDIYNACSSLKTVCEQVAKPDTGREKTPFAPIAYFAACKPMLASVPTWNSVISRMNGCPFYVEDKFDGERILIHKRGKEVKLFTRNSIDYTNRYNYGATFTPIVLKALGDTESVVNRERCALHLLFHC
jgi:DNA ligase-4